MTRLHCCAAWMHRTVLDPWLHPCRSAAQIFPAAWWHSAYEPCVIHVSTVLKKKKKPLPAASCLHCFPCPALSLPAALHCPCLSLARTARTAHTSAWFSLHSCEPGLGLGNLICRSIALWVSLTKPPTCAPAMPWTCAQRKGTFRLESGKKVKHCY